MAIAVVAVTAGGAGYGVGHGSAGGNAARKSSAGARPVAHPCTLLTSAVVARSLATTIDGISSADGSCTWHGHALGSFTGAQPQLMLGAARGVTRTQFLKDFSTSIVAGSAGTMVRAPNPPVHGVGQVAFWTSMGQELNVWDHGTVVTISSAFVTSPLAVEKRLAAAVLARLGH